MRLIDADALIPRFDDYVVPIYTDEIIEAIQDEPTIDPVKHGHWITEMRYSEFYEMNLEESVCSCCGYNTGSALAKKLYDYCYKCGANMDEEVSE